MSFKVPANPNSVFQHTRVTGWQRKEDDPCYSPGTHTDFPSTQERKSCAGEENLSSTAGQKTDVSEGKLVPFPAKRAKSKQSDHPGIAADVVMFLMEERMVAEPGWTHPLKNPTAVPGESPWADPSPISQQNQLRRSGACWGISHDLFHRHRQLSPASRKAQAVPTRKAQSSAAGLRLEQY